MQKVRNTIAGEELSDRYVHGKDKYLLVNVVAKRSKQLIAAEPALVSREGMATPLDVVSAEMEAAKLAVREKFEEEEAK